MRCPNCRTTRDVAAYLAKLPLRCTACGGGLVVGTAEEPIALEPAPAELTPKATILDDPPLPPLVPLPPEATQQLPAPSDDSSARLQLSDKLREIVSLTPAPNELSP
jgi:hypothetical protein